MSLNARRSDRPVEPSLYFTSSDLKDVFPHEDDLVVIFVVTLGQKVHIVLIDQGSSTDVMLRKTYTNLKISRDQLRNMMVV